MKHSEFYPHQIEFIRGWMPVTALLGPLASGKTTALVSAIAYRSAGLALSGEKHEVLVLVRDLRAYRIVLELVARNLDAHGIVERWVISHAAMSLSVHSRTSVHSSTGGSCKIYFRFFHNFEKWRGGSYSLWFADDLTEEGCAAVMTARSRARGEPGKGFVTSSEMSPSQVRDLFGAMNVQLIEPNITERSAAPADEESDS